MNKPNKFKIISGKERSHCMVVIHLNGKSYTRHLKYNSGRWIGRSVATGILFDYTYLVENSSFASAQKVA